jgi:lipoyl(octanoyl) transferase
VTPPVGYVCPECRGALRAGPGRLECAACGRSYPVDDGIADFSGGKYYDRFVPGQDLSAPERAGLAAEAAGASSRIHDFYGPILRSLPRSRPLRVLDSGCGGGYAVDILRDAGLDAWGVDLSALRRWQWRERAARDRLACADSLRLPFADGSFDAVLCSGVLEHVGVEEMGGGDYRVRPLPDRDAQRVRFLGEHARILAPDGTLYLDFPNGAFPIDFWHGARPGAPRWHSRSEGFLPTAGEVRAYADALGGGWALDARSPRGRLRFRQVGAHWWGRLLAPLAAAYLAALDARPLAPLLETGWNPFLVLELRRRAPPGRSAARTLGRLKSMEALAIRTPRPIRAPWLGRVDYDRALDLQAEAAERAREGDESFLLLEHEPVFTLGRSASRADVLFTPERCRELGIAVRECDRGGKVTYHGPGQLVGYPVLNLAPDRKDVKRYVTDLEEVLIRALDDFGIGAARSPVRERVTSVWVGNDKIAAIGIHISRWITTHGFALNVTDEPLAHFAGIVACGISDGGVTTIERRTGRRLSLEEVAARVRVRFGQVFGREIIPA